VQSSGDAAGHAAQVRTLIGLGCQTVRIEGAAAPERAFKPVLDAVCDFLGPGDRLLVPDVTHLGCSPSAAETFQDRLKARGAELRFLNAETPGEDVHPTGPVQIMPLTRAPAPPAGPKSVDAGMVLALSAHGFGPSQIARKLGVSRMTVWRRLAAAGA
jgi:DNA invertase Pin-like site-specific DNA recombinase